MMTLKTLRLILFEDCNRNCSGCCNKYFDIPGLPVAKSYHEYEMILLTGGEPMLDPIKIIHAIKAIRLETSVPVILYTAKTDPALNLLAILHYVDGVTVTLHDRTDVAPFSKFNNLLLASDINKSFRLNIFRGINISGLDISKWQIKNDITWIKNDSLPDGEILMRWNQGGSTWR